MEIDPLYRGAVVTASLLVFVPFRKPLSINQTLALAPELSQATKFDLLRAGVKFAINFPIIRFEFFTGNFHALKLLHAYLRFFDGSLGIFGALAYLVAGVAAKSKKDVALMATAADVTAAITRWALKYGDKWAENKIKESQPPDKQGYKAP
ncbi:hypothetical protein Asppvi_009476 [Aspergillus pseudoviridinutans]|uniref:Uncharacterized protein n=1 Tax=Aspergillus pseudoviridinutans TaxID=1517512 RepID=A0A9P3EZ71_9EURO|nr:uncharacterized protein Asppvi_009476 [Aspergillus pseudoviridinutans]GIJ90520.1 hypothetical protein Asppvi_009476 [Aspergillus pseudoviridinutans]